MREAELVVVVVVVLVGAVVVLVLALRIPTMMLWPTLRALREPFHARSWLRETL
jgi:hypothetical protein